MRRYDATIPAGGNVSFGFQGTWHASDAPPTAFTLNGSACATGQPGQCSTVDG